MHLKLSAICSIIFLLIFFLIPKNTYAFSGSGTGTSGDPYEISTCLQLQEIQNDLGAYYDIHNNINCTGVTFTPIGVFTGTLNGYNYEISNISITATGSNVGFFGQTNGATISNLRLISGTVVSAQAVSYMGSIVGSASNTTISHSSSSLTLSPNGTSYTGGIVSNTSGGLTIEKSYFDGTINNNNGAASTGGIVGSVSGSSNTVSNSYSAGTIHAGASGYGGALVGIVYSNITVTNSYTGGTFTHSSSSYVSGFIAGFFAGSVTNSFAGVDYNGGGSFYRAMYGVGNGTSTGNYYDTFLAGISTCSYSGSANCTAVNSGNSTPNYFKNNTTNAPLTNWDFVAIWQTGSSSYPTLQGFSAPAASPTQTPTPTPTGSPTPTVFITQSESAPQVSSTSLKGCSDSQPIHAPDLFQINTTSTTASLYFTSVSQQVSDYVIAFGYSSGDQRFGGAIGNNVREGVILYSVQSLSPNTTYYLKVRAQNGCMPGEWSNEMSFTTSRLQGGEQVFYKNFTSQVLSVFKKNTTDAGGTKVLGKNTKSKQCVYTVKSGDSLWDIASDNLGSGTKYNEIMEDNNLSSTFLRIGQEIFIQCKQ